MLDPMSYMMKDLRKMNDDLTERLDNIISLMNQLITETKNNRPDYYGDGK